MIDQNKKRSDKLFNFLLLKVKFVLQKNFCQGSEKKIHKVFPGVK